MFYSKILIQYLNEKSNGLNLFLNDFKCIWTLSPKTIFEDQFDQSFLRELFQFKFQQRSLWKKRT